MWRMLCTSAIVCSRKNMHNFVSCVFCHCCCCQLWILVFSAVKHTYYYVYPRLCIYSFFCLNYCMCILLLLVFFCSFVVIPAEWTTFFCQFSWNIRLTGCTMSSSYSMFNINRLFCILYVLFSYLVSLLYLSICVNVPEFTSQQNVHTFKKVQLFDEFAR